MLKIIHCADIHAGRPAPAELDPGKASVRRREIESSLSRIVDLTAREKADMLLISGDLFEHLYARPSWVKEAAALLRSIPTTRVFIAPGNHDPVVKGSFYKSVEWPKNVTVFDSSKIVGVDVDGVPVVVHGFGWTAFSERQEALRGYSASRPDLVNILIIHGDLSRQKGGETSAYLPISTLDIENSGMDYAALGHIHSPGEFRAGKTVAAYAGCPEPLDFGDEGERGVFMVRIGDRLTGPSGQRDVRTEFIPMATRLMRKAEVDVSGIETPEQVRQAVAALGDEASRKKDLWSVSLTGSVEPELSLDLPVLQREAGEGFFFLRLNARYRPSYDLAALGDRSKESLEAKFVREMRAAMEGASLRKDGRQADVAELALYYGLDALRQGKILLRKGGSD